MLLEPHYSRPRFCRVVVILGSSDNSSTHEYNRGVVPHENTCMPSPNCILRISTWLSVGHHGFEHLNMSTVTYLSLGGAQPDLGDRRKALALRPAGTSASRFFVTAWSCRKSSKAGLLGRETLVVALLPPYLLRTAITPRGCQSLITPTYYCRVLSSHLSGL